MKAISYKAYKYGYIFPNYFRRKVLLVSLTDIKFMNLFEDFLVTYFKIKQNGKLAAWKIFLSDCGMHHNIDTLIL